MNIDNLSNSHQEISISDRERLTVTGVLDVTSFDECSILIKTCFGMLAVDGEELRIASLSTDTGELYIEGHIGGVVYFEESSDKKRKGIFKR